MVSSENEVKKRLQELDNWELEEAKIVKNFSFKSFMQAMEFVNEVANIAEKQNHHPIITIIWKTVKISSISFDVGHLTDRDFRLAKAIDELYDQKFGEKLTGKDYPESEDKFLVEEESKDKARKRTRGPYRKSSRIGL